MTVNYLLTCVTLTLSLVDVYYKELKYKLEWILTEKSVDFCFLLYKYLHNSCAVKLKPLLAYYQKVCQYFSFGSYLLSYLNSIILSLFILVFQMSQNFSDALSPSWRSCAFAASSVLRVPSGVGGVPASFELSCTTPAISHLLWVL